MNGKEADSSGIGIYKGDVSSEIKHVRIRRRIRSGLWPDYVGAL